MLSHFFSPQSIAIIGASDDPMKFGYAVTNNLLKNKNLSSSVYLVSTSKKNILDHDTFPSLLTIPYPVDLVVILIPAKYILSIIDESIQKKVQAIIIITAGFREMGEQGKKDEIIIVQKCLNAGIRVIGPNCVGIINRDANMNLSFIQNPLRGNVSMISQSGSFGAACFWAFNHHQIGISKFVNLGNAADISFSEALEFLATDQNTNVIAIYLESIQNGRSFYDQLQKISPKKPIVVLKGGKSIKGMEAANSHTGSIATNYLILKAAVNQGGGIICETMRDFITILKTFSSSPLPNGNNIAILTSSGGGGVLFSDFAEQYGLNFADFSNSLKNIMKKWLSPLVKLANPLDMIASAGNLQYYEITKAMLIDNTIDIVVSISLFGDFMGNTPEGHLQSCIRAWNESGRKKPLIPLMISEEQFESVQKLIKEERCPVYYTPQEAALAIKVLIERFQFKEHLKQEKKISKKII